MERVKASGNQTTQREGVDRVSTHSVRIHYTKEVPDEVRAIFSPLLTRWGFLVPTWCHSIDIHWDDQDDSGALRVGTHYEYREADIYVLANFLTTPENREQQVVHELMHLSLAPLTKVAESLRDALVKKAPDVEEWANEQFRQGEEATVCDLTALVMERIAA